MSLYVPKDDLYTPAYVAFVKTILHLRALRVPTEKVEELWSVEKRLLTMLHADSNGSLTWYLDSCGNNSHRERRLFLSNYDIGIPLPSGYVQLELDFAQRLSELFSPDDMGEDVLRQFQIYMERSADVIGVVRKELKAVRAAVKWASGIV